MHLATVSKRLDLADDVLVLRRLVEKVLVVCDELGDAPFQLFVVALFDGDLGRDLLEVLAKLGVEVGSLSVRPPKQTRLDPVHRPCKRDPGPS